MINEIFITLSSVQIARQVSFYSYLLEIEPKISTATYAEFRLLGLRLAVFCPKASNVDEFLAKTSGAMSLCLEVKDLAYAFTRLHSLGYPPPGEIMHPAHGAEIYAYDPDGNRLILHQSATTSKLQL